VVTARPVPMLVALLLLVAGLVAACGGQSPVDRRGGAEDADPARSDTTSARGGLFREVGAELGLVPDLSRAEDGRWFMPDSMAGGVALADVDGDGDLDTFFVHGRWRAGAPTPDGLGRLWLQGADGRFTDASADSGVIGPHYGMGVASGDIDNDGDVDLYVTCYGPDVLLRNRGDGTFEDVSQSAGIRAAPGTGGWGASCTFVDVDADGWLDLFVTNYVEYPESEQSRDSRGQPEYTAPGNYPGTPDVLLANRGDGTFIDVSESSGIAASRGRGLGVAAADFDADGRVDLYVANDGEANFCWIQRERGAPQHWRFEERALALGIALDGDGRPEAGMGVARGDVDGDGREDLFLTHLVQETHTLYLSRAISSARTGASYTDRTLRAGLAAPTVDLTGFGVVFADFDLDGLLDILAVHGRVLRGAERAGASEPPRWRPYAEPDLVFLGRMAAANGAARTGAASGDTPRFELADGGDLARHVETSRGLAVGDVDGDGDLDALVTTASGRVRLYAGTSEPGRAWLAVRAIDGARGGRDVLGAVVEVATRGRTQRRTIQTAHGYLSASEPVARFGFGAVESGSGPPALDSLTVQWPDGVQERFDASAGTHHTPDGHGRIMTLVRGSGSPR
jgi:hypothetical protein